MQLVHLAPSPIPLNRQSPERADSKADTTLVSVPSVRSVQYMMNDQYTWINCCSSLKFNNLVLWLYFTILGLNELII